MKYQSMGVPSHLRQPKVCDYRLASSFSADFNYFVYLGGLVLMVSIEFERGSNLANQPTVVDTMKLPSNMSATEFRHAIVDAMGLDIEVARLAYTITGKIGRPVSRAFNTDEQVNYAKHDVLGAMSRARSKQKGLSIKNLV